MRRVLVVVTAMIVAAVSCTEGSAPDGPPRGSARSARSARSGGTAVADAIVIGFDAIGSGSDADTMGSDAGTMGSDADTMGSDAGTMGSDAGTGGQLDVMPTTLVVNDVTVGASGDRVITVRNTGTGPLTFSASLIAGMPAWSTTAVGESCISPGECPLAGGSSIAIGVRFSPTAINEVTGTLSVTTTGDSRTVTLIGQPIGSRLVVTQPANLALDFGTIARNSTASRPITVQADGNQALAVSASDPGAPFSVTPMELTLSPLLPDTFSVTCSSPVSTGPVDRMIQLSAPSAYDGQNTQVAIHCEVANTQVSLAPQLDFDEVRRGTPAKILPFTITNPGTLDAMLQSVELVGAPSALSMSLPDSFPPVLPAGQMVSGRMTLTTDEDIDLAASAPKLKISVDGEQLAYPVTGKVTTPAAYVTPEKLELGTACIGSSVTATVAMVNSGTARLLMAPPELSPSFTLQLQTPASYPAPLLAGTMATIGISPTTQAPGALTGTLTWSVDAPRSPFKIPVSLALIDTGTAISPASLSFSTVKVNEISLRYMVTLQNCSTVPVMVTVEGVGSVRGGAAAWKVEPSYDVRTLAPQDKLTIGVAFAPLRHGHHVAELQLIIDGERKVVRLEGDGVDLDFKQTSFYACGCSTPHVRTGWPIALAVALAMLRRRRRPRRA